MRITLCGSARFEKEFKDLNEQLTLAGHVVYSLAVYPSDHDDNKDWYTESQKAMLDAIHLEKIDNSDGIVVIAPGQYIGESTRREIEYAREKGKVLMSQSPLGDGFVRICPYKGCSDPLRKPPCALCYE